MPPKAKPVAKPKVEKIQCAYKRDGVLLCNRWAIHKPLGACKTYCFRHTEKWIACENPEQWERNKKEMKESLDIDLDESYEDEMENSKTDKFRREALKHF